MSGSQNAKNIDQIQQRPVKANLKSTMYVHELLKMLTNDFTLVDVQDGDASAPTILKNIYDYCGLLFSTISQARTFFVDLLNSNKELLEKYTDACVTWAADKLSPVEEDNDREKSDIVHSAVALQDAKKRVVPLGTHFSGPYGTYNWCVRSTLVSSSEYISRLLREICVRNKVHFWPETTHVWIRYTNLRNGKEVEETVNLKAGDSFVTLGWGEGSNHIHVDKDTMSGSQYAVVIVLSMVEHEGEWRQMISLMYLGSSYGLYSSRGMTDGKVIPMWVLPFEAKYGETQNAYFASCSNKDPLLRVRMVKDMKLKLEFKLEKGPKKEK